MLRIELEPGELHRGFQLNSLVPVQDRRVLDLWELLSESVGSLIHVYPKKPSQISSGAATTQQGSKREFEMEVKTK